MKILFIWALNFLSGQVRELVVLDAYIKVPDTAKSYVRRGRKAADLKSKDDWAAEEKTFVKFGSFNNEGGDAIKKERLIKFHL